MFGVLQNWLALDGFPQSALVQSGACWLNLEGYDSLTFWLEAPLATGAQLILHYETAPIMEPTLFAPMASVAMSSQAAPIVTAINPLALNTVPLAGLVRWRLEALGGNLWQATFRVRFSAKRLGVS